MESLIVALSAALHYAQHTAWQLILGAFLRAALADLLSHERLRRLHGSLQATSLAASLILVHGLLPLASALLHTLLHCL